LGPARARRPRGWKLLKKTRGAAGALSSALRRRAAAAIKTCEVAAISTPPRLARCAAIRARRRTHCSCVVEDVADLWRWSAPLWFHGRYHVLGAATPLDGITPEGGVNVCGIVASAPKDVRPRSSSRWKRHGEGQTTAHYLLERAGLLGARKVTALGGTACRVAGKSRLPRRKHALPPLQARPAM